MNPVNDNMYMHYLDRVHKTLYDCNVRTIYLRSVEDIEEYGFLRTGIKHLDAAASKEIVHVMISPFRISQIIAAGGTVGLIHRHDARPIYEDIHMYCQLWKTKIESSPIIEMSWPIEDLIMLDSAAKVLYPHAERMFPKGQQDPLLEKFFGRHTGMKIPTFTPKKKAEEEAHQVGEHDPSAGERFGRALNVQSISSRYRRGN